MAFLVILFKFAQIFVQVNRVFKFFLIAICLDLYPAIVRGSQDFSTCAKILMVFRHPIQATKGQIILEVWNASILPHIKGLGRNEVELYRVTTKIPGLRWRHSFVALRKERADILVERKVGDERIHAIPLSLQFEHDSFLIPGRAFLDTGRGDEKLSFLDRVRITFEILGAKMNLSYHEVIPGIRLELSEGDKEYFESVVRGEYSSLSEDGIESYLRNKTLSKIRRVYLAIPKP